MNMNNLIHERLDRYFTNDSWIAEYPKSTVTYLPRTHSYHCHFLINIKNDIRPSNSKPFRFESLRFGQPSFPNLVQYSFSHNTTLIQATHQFKIDVIQWNKNTFENIFHKKNRLMAGMVGIQKSPHYQHNHFFLNLEAKLIKDYNFILKNEEDFWKLKAGIHWLADGDANTRFFSCFHAQ